MANLLFCYDWWKPVIPMLPSLRVPFCSQELPRSKVHYLHLFMFNFLMQVGGRCEHRYLMSQNSACLSPFLHHLIRSLSLLQTHTPSHTPTHTRARTHTQTQWSTCRANLDIYGRQGDKLFNSAAKRSQKQNCGHAYEVFVRMRRRPTHRQG